MKQILALIAFLWLAGWTAPAMAKQIPTCGSVSMSAVTFSPIAAQSGATTQTSGTLSYSCSGFTANASVYVCLSIGAGTGGYSGGNTSRMMTSGANSLAYQLYYDGYSGTAFPNGTNVAFSETSSGTGTLTGTIPIYAIISALPGTAIAGSYSSNFTSDFTFHVGWDSTCNQFSSNPGLSVSGTLSTGCTVSADPLAFGTVHSLDTAITANTYVNVTCTNASSYTISLGMGNGTSTTATNRHMSDGSGHILSYGIYQNSALTTEWGDTLNTNTQAGTGTGSVQNVAAYGKLNVQSMPPSGNYSDSVIVTVTYN